MEPFNYKRLCKLLPESHFYVSRTADELIYMTWRAQFCLSAFRDELSDITPSENGNYSYWLTVGICAQPTDKDWAAVWRSFVNAPSVCSLTITDQVVKDVLPKRVFQNEQGKPVFVLNDLVNVLSSSFRRLQKHYRFEQLAGGPIRVVFSQDGVAWHAIAVLAPCASKSIGSDLF